MHRTDTHADSHLRLTRRLLLAAVLTFAAIRVVPAALEPAGGPDDGPPERILVAAETPIDAIDLGRLIAPFEVDDVDHSKFGWALLDRTAGEVLVLDALGADLRRFGRRGAGPGELERPSRLALGGSADVAVLDASGQRLDLFPESGPPRRIPIQATDCRGTFGDELARHAGSWWILRRCFEGPNADIEVIRVGDDGEAERVERRVLSRMNNDPHLVPLLLAHEGVLYAGSNRDACLIEVGSEPDRVRRLCLPRPAPIAIPDSVATRLFGDLGRRAAAVGLDLNIPTHYPGIVGARVAIDGPVVRTILADGSDTWAYEVNDTLHVLAPPAGIRVEPGESAWLLLRDEGAGLRVWTVPRTGGVVRPR